MAEMQNERHVELFTPLGEDVLLFKRMSVFEELGRMFQFDMELFSKKPDIRFEDILGKNITIRLDLPKRKKRWFNGFVSRFNQSDTNTGEDFTAYGMTVRPWLWFLTRTADCRIFREKPVPEIIKEIFTEQGFTDFEDNLIGDYRKWEFCVQYRETDFNFVSRLMEQEGIYYYFRHEKEKHVLILADDASAHEPFPDYDEIPYFPPDDGLRREKEHIYDWNISCEVKPGVYTLDEFDFKNPKANLEVKAAVARGHAMSSLEIFDYPGEYVKPDEGETYARIRIEELHARYELISGAANAKGIATGSLFTLSGYPRRDQNREYIVVSACYDISSTNYITGSGGNGEIFACDFKVLDSKNPFRSERITPKPIIQGPQTAIVVGEPGKEITTEKYGRVKVQFHWDRYGKLDMKSSCWVRVSHPWAGKNWGSVAIPRYGQEVIVEFLEGDPDYPIITGRVYNNDTMPPYKLPGKGMISGLKSNSTPGGGGYNEMSMDDTKGQEMITIHAQYDMNTTVEHDQTLVVHNNRTDTIDVDDTETVKGNQTLAVNGNRSESVNGTENVAIDGATTHTVKSAYTRNVFSNYSLSAGSNISNTAGTNWEGNAGAKLTLRAPQIKLEAGAKIEIICGGSAVILEPSKITISSGSGNIDVHSPGVDIKGGKIQLN